MTNARLSTRLGFLSLALLLLASAAARAQGQNTLEGRVMLPSGMQPTQSVRVTLTQSGRPVYETFTDLSGRFNFPGLRSGTYQLTAEGDDQTFETTSVTVDINGGLAQTFTQNIQLVIDAAPSPVRPRVT